MMILTAIGIFLAGLCAGYLVNYLADVLPLYRRPGQPVCLSCNRAFSWEEYLTFQRCKACRRRRSIRAWLLIMLYPVVALLIWLFPPLRLNGWAAGLLLIYFGVVATIDLEHRVVLNEVSLAGVAVGLIFGFLLHGWQMTLLGGVAGYGIMYGLYLLGVLFSRIVARIRKEDIDEVALGYGDVNLSGILGLLLGWPGITLGLLFAILIGGVASAIYLIILKVSRKYELFTAIPYAPFLILGAILLLYRPG